jgi:hypothetical protein
MKTADKEKLYEDVIVLEKEIRKKYPKQDGRVKIANAKSDIDMEVGRIDNTNEVPWMIQYRDKLRELTQ